VDVLDVGVTGSFYSRLDLSSRQFLRRNRAQQRQCETGGDERADKVLHVSSLNGGYLQAPD
jgi:hypothetical protein